MTMKPNEMTPSVVRNNQYQAPFTSGRWLDPIRAAALHEAIQAWPDMAYSTVTEKTKGDPIAEVLQLAERFERYLVGDSNGDSEDAR